MFEFREFSAGEVFLKAGELQPYAGFLLKGLFRYYYIDYEGHDLTKYFVGGNQFVLSLNAMIDQKPSSFFIEALEDSAMLMIPIGNLGSLIQSSPLWRRVYFYLLERNYLAKERREAEFLLYNAKDRYLRFLKEQPELCRRVKQHHLATFLGIAPESLSRIRQQINNC